VAEANSGGTPADRDGGAVCGQCFGRVRGCKGERGSSSSPLNRNERREGGGSGMVRRPAVGHRWPAAITGGGAEKR
jgi:hypothetical protein